MIMPLTDFSVVPSRAHYFAKEALNASLHQDAGEFPMNSTEGASRTSQRSAAHQNGSPFWSRPAASSPLFRRTEKGVRLELRFEWTICRGGGKSAPFCPRQKEGNKLRSMCKKPMLFAYAFCQNKMHIAQLAMINAMPNKFIARRFMPKRAVLAVLTHTYQKFNLFDDYNLQIF